MNPDAILHFFPLQGEIIGPVFYNHQHPEPVLHEKVLYDGKTIKKLLWQKK